MDNPEYIKMVLALPDEFFEGWEWQAGDKALVNNEVWTVFGGNTNGMVVIGENLQLFSIGNLDFSYKIGEKARPIPSQEQLQKMTGLTPIGFIEDLYEYSQEPPQPDEDNEIFMVGLTSFTLAYVVYRKYGRYWNGEVWV